ncbi:MAG: OmpA family protein [Tenuifilaceae bacterium]
MQKQSFFWKWIFSGVIIYILISPLNSYSQETFTSTRYVLWQNINGFSINEEEDLLILEMIVSGRSMLFQSKKVDGAWTEALPLVELNDYLGNTANLGGPFICFKGTKLYFHANFSDSKGGMDIYSSDWDGKSWSKPMNIGEPLNTFGNEESPSITVTNDKIFFTRDNPISKEKRKIELTQCKTIYYSTKNLNGNWENPLAIFDPVNLDCEANPFIAPDGKTLYFSSIRDNGESFDLYFTREVVKDVWLIPLLVAGTNSENDDLDPQYNNGNVYHITSFVKKKVFNGSIYLHSVTDDIKPLPTVNVEGTIVDLNGNPLEATLQVFDPITSEIIGVFSSNPSTGKYSLPLLSKNKYLINIRKNGYSFSTFEEDLTGIESKEPEKRTISLFNSISLKLSIFDSEIFRPLVSDILIINKETDSKMSINSTPLGEGIYKIDLPIGLKYKIAANTPGFESGEMDFYLTDDIIYSQFERNVPLKPVKKEFQINVTDFETSENVAAEIVINNLDRDEVIVVTAEDIKSGKVSVMLREGDKYEFNIKGPKGYSFYNNTVDLKSDTEKRSLDVELKPLNAQTSITLNNITFEKNSSDLNEASFSELNRVVSLIQDNTNLIVEISAHTDDAGSDQYNLVLSERRADSVVKYLVENNVPVIQLVAKGYGESVPVVPNTTDENRAQNRRVEFKIIGFVSDAK